MLNYLIVYCSKPMYVLPLNPSICHRTVGVTHIGVHKQRKRNALLAISTIGVCFSTAFHWITIVKFQMTADQSLYVKVCQNFPNRLIFQWQY